MYEGDTKAPNKMQPGAVYNLIEELEKEDISPENLDRENKIPITESAREIIDHAVNLASIWKRDKKDSIFRQDHVRLLVLSAQLYRDVPYNLEQYIFHKQETLSQSRWCTTASGYARVFLFGGPELSPEQDETLRAVLGFILNVYVPAFIEINLHPSVPDAPGIVLKTRDLMKAHGVADKVKEIFIDHAEKWLCPKNAAVVIHKEVPPVLPEDLRKLGVFSVNTRELCWSSKGIKSFLSVESACAPCVSAGSSSYWRAIDNHNWSCERYIGKMGLVLKNKWVQDSKSAKLDEKVRGYVLNMEDKI